MVGHLRVHHRTCAGPVVSVVRLIVLIMLDSAAGSSISQLRRRTRDTVWNTNLRLPEWLLLVDGTAGADCRCR
jgi:hypothetical protein